MKTVNVKKIIAIFTTVSLAFLQVVPVGVAAGPVGSEQEVPTGVSPAPYTDALKTPADSTSPATTASVSKPQTLDGFLQGEGARTLTLPTPETPAKDPGPVEVSSPMMQEYLGKITPAEDPRVVEASGELIPEPSNDPSEALTGEQLQTWIAQLEEEARLLEVQAVAQTQQASALNTQAAAARRTAAQILSRAQTQEASAQALMSQGQSALRLAERDRTIAMAREAEINKQLIILRNKKTGPFSQMTAARKALEIKRLQAELEVIRNQKASISRRISNANAIINDANTRLKIASVTRAEGNQRLQMANKLERDSTLLFAEAKTARANIAAKVALVNQLIVVRDYVKVLQEKVGDGFNVTATPQKDGTYLIIVKDAKDYFAKPTGGLSQLSFKLSGDGKPDDATIEATYYSAGEDLVLSKDDSKLLYNAMGACPQGQSCTLLGDMEKLTKMTKITVTKVEEGAIFYTDEVNDKNYKVNRDGTVEEIVPVPREIMADAQAILGDRVSRAQQRPSTVKDNSITWDFYDADNKLVGSMVRVALESAPPDRWYNDQGVLVAEVSKSAAGNVIRQITYAYNDQGEKTMTSDVMYDAAGNPVRSLQTMQNHEGGVTGTIDTQYFPGTDKVKSVRTDLVTTIPPGAIYPIPITITINTLVEYNEAGVKIHEVSYLTGDQPSTEDFYDNAGKITKRIEYDDQGNVENVINYESVVSPFSVTVAVGPIGRSTDAVVDVAADGHVTMTVGGTVLEGQLDPATMIVNLANGVNEYRLGFQKKDPADAQNVFLASFGWKSLRWTSPGVYWIYDASSATWDASGTPTSSQMIQVSKNEVSRDQYMVYESSEYLQTFVSKRVGMDAEFDTNFSWILARKPDFLTVYDRFSQLIEQNRVPRIRESEVVLALDPHGFNNMRVHIYPSWEVQITVDGEEFTGQIDRSTMTATFQSAWWNSYDVDAYVLSFAQKPGEPDGSYYVEGIETKNIYMDWREGWIGESHYDVSGALDPNRFYEAQILTSGSGQSVMYGANMPVLLEGGPIGDAILQDFLDPQATPGLMQRIRDFLGIVE